VDRLDVGELADLVLLDLGEERAHGPVIGPAGVFVADLGGEQFEEAPDRVVAGVGDHRRYRRRRGCHLASDLIRCIVLTGGKDPVELNLGQKYLSQP
jgi:hypothetical protein